MNDRTASVLTFGGFALGSLQLALPISALREVVRCQELSDLPSPALYVIGGINLRGMVVPVVDLRILLGRSAPAQDGRNVVIVTHDNRLLGLLADGLNGLFDAVEGSYNRMNVSAGDATAAIFCATVQRSDSRELISVLSTEALSRLPQVPMVEHDDPGGLAIDEAQGNAVVRDAGLAMLLLSCNGIPLAVEATAVHATLSNPAIESDSTSGNALDTIVYSGVKIPVLDLLELCGLGRLPSRRGIAALVISLPPGYVALLVSAVVEVIATTPSAVNVLSTFALTRPELFAGSLPASALPPALITRVGASVSQYLVLDAAQLRACEDVVALAQLNVAVNGAGSGSKGSSANGFSRAGRRPMITYMLETERATPLDQVVEILAYRPETEIFGAAGPMLGFMMNRGRSIPVLCLGQASGEGGGARTASSRVLVVESGGELVGFTVRKLNSIEEADWEPATTVNAGRATGRAGGPNKLALFGTRTTDRLLPILDLQQIAESVRHGGPARQLSAV